MPDFLSAEKVRMLSCAWSDREKRLCGEFCGPEVQELCFNDTELDWILRV